MIKIINITFLLNLKNCQVILFFLRHVVIVLKIRIDRNKEFEKKIFYFERSKRSKVTNFLLSLNPF